MNWPSLRPPPIHRSADRARRATQVGESLDPLALVKPIHLDVFWDDLVSTRTRRGGREARGGGGGEGEVGRLSRSLAKYG